MREGSEVYFREGEYRGREEAEEADAMAKVAKKEIARSRGTEKERFGEREARTP